jgi:3',5'-cyclic AMP phosphodiesterase CpdA
MLTRRQMLRRSAAGLLAVTLGSRASAATSEPPLFRFIVISDIHCRDERCITWFKKIAASMRRHEPDFLVINGDLSDDGSAAQLTGVKEVFGALGVPIYATLGNHDYAIGNDHTPFNQVFPNSLNYHFDHAGWQFVGLDSTDGRRVIFTTVQPGTLAWLDKNLPALDKTKPTVLLTHFPMGQAVLCRPINADQILSRFDGYNLRAAFNGHWHGYAENHFEHASVTNSRCGSWWRDNTDGSPDKGYFYCEATQTGEVRHQFNVIT